MEYTVTHSTDASGGRYMESHPVDIETDDLAEACRVGNRLQARGQGANIRRADGAEMLPDPFSGRYDVGCRWVGADGELE